MIARSKGLTESTFWFGWLVTYIIQFALMSILVTLVGSSTVYKHSDKTVIFVFFFLFMVD